MRQALTTMGVDKQTARKIRAIAKKSGVSCSEVIRVIVDLIGARKVVVERKVSLK